MYTIWAGDTELLFDMADPTRSKRDSKYIMQSRNWNSWFT